MAQLHSPSPSHYPMQCRPAFNWKRARQRVRLEAFIIEHPVLSSAYVCLPIMLLGYIAGLLWATG